MDNRTIVKRRRDASVYDNARNLYDKYAYDYIPDEENLIDKITLSKDDTIRGRATTTPNPGMYTT